MDKVTLLPGIEASRLGFGCAPILGSVDAARSSKALALAWENGVNYFDVAPSYGFGEAEEFLGKFLSGRRNQAVVATKFGIQAHGAAKFLAPLKSVVRALKPRRTPSGGQSIAGAASRLLQRVPITPEGMTASVERSLKRLRTDYLDLLLIHEPQQTIPSPGLLIETAAKLKAAGKIKAFGVAAPFEEHRGLHWELGRQLDLLQIGIPEEAHEFQKLASDRGPSPNVLYEVVKNRSAYAAEGMSVPQSLELLARLFPSSVLLCSMFSERHLVENCTAISKS
jgi:Aldo/keto reductase family